MHAFEITPPPVNPAQKVNGRGKGAILTPERAQLLFEGGFVRDRDRVLFGVCYFTGCRISEALQLLREDVDLEGRVITFRGTTLKGRGYASRQVMMPPKLVQFFEWYEGPNQGYVFPSHAKAEKQGYMTRMQAHRILKTACQRVGLVGVSTHSFRRSYISGLWKHGMSPHQIKALTGHRSMASLMEYLDNW